MRLKLQYKKKQVKVIFMAGQTKLSIAANRDDQYLPSIISGIS